MSHANTDEMADAKCIDVQAESPAMPVAIRESQTALVPTHETLKPAVTAAQAKIEAVANLTASAYAKASELRLSAEEITALQADFPDEAFKPGAAGKENLLYIEHAFLRDRLNQVIGPGQWALIPRSRWTEDFTTAKGQPASRVYVEAMLMVRGCFVAEAVGEMEYWKNNASQNYGDAVEGAKTAALRRCCKEFGIGLQAWKKDWCSGWWARKNSSPRQTQPTTIVHPRNTTPPPPPAKPEPKHATEVTRNWMIEQLAECREIATEYFHAVNQLMPNEALEDLPLESVPINKEQLALLKERIEGFQRGDAAERAFPPNQMPLEKKAAPINVGKNANAGADEPWRSFPMPFGKHAGTNLGDLEKKYLFGLWANFVVETEYNGKQKRPESIAKDQQFREMLDAAGAHYQFKKD